VFDSDANQHFSFYSPIQQSIDTWPRGSFPHAAEPGGHESNTMKQEK